MFNAHHLVSVDEKEQQQLLSQCLRALGSLPDLGTKKIAVSLSIECRNQRADRFTELFDRIAPGRGETMERLLDVVRTATDLDEVNFLRLTSEVKESDEEKGRGEVMTKRDKRRASKHREKNVQKCEEVLPTTAVEVAATFAIVGAENKEEGGNLETSQGLPEKVAEPENVEKTDKKEEMENVEEPIGVPSADADHPPTNNSLSPPKTDQFEISSNDISDTKDAMPADLQTKSQDSNMDRKKKKKHNKRRNKNKSTTSKGPSGFVEIMEETDSKAESTVRPVEITVPNEKHVPKTSVGGALKTLVSFVTGSANVPESEEKAREFEQISMGSFIKSLWSSDGLLENLAEADVSPVMKANTQGKEKNGIETWAAKSMAELDREEKALEETGSDGQVASDSRSVIAINCNSEIGIVSVVEDTIVSSEAPGIETPINQMSETSIVDRECILSIVHDLKTELNNFMQKCDLSAQQDTTAALQQEKATKVAREEARNKPGERRASKCIVTKIVESRGIMPTATVEVSGIAGVGTEGERGLSGGTSGRSEDGTEDGQIKSCIQRELETADFTTDQPRSFVAAEKYFVAAKDMMVVSPTDADRPSTNTCPSYPKTRQFEIDSQYLPDNIPELSNKNEEIPANSENPNIEKKKKKKNRKNRNKKKNSSSKGPSGSNESMAETGVKDETTIEPAASKEPNEKQVFEASVIPIHTMPKTSVGGALKTLVSFVTGAANAPESKEKARESEQISMGSFIKSLWLSEETEAQVPGIDVQVNEISTEQNTKNETSVESDDTFSEIKTELEGSRQQDNSSARKQQDTTPTYEREKEAPAALGKGQKEPPTRTAGPFTTPCSRLYPSVISCSCPGHRNIPAIGQVENVEIPSPVSMDINASPYVDGMMVLESTENIWHENIDLAKTVFANEPIQNYFPRRRICMPELSDPAIIRTGTFSTLPKFVAASSDNGSTELEGEQRRSMTKSFGIPISIEDLMGSAAPPRYAEGPNHSQSKRLPMPPPGLGLGRTGPAPKPQSQANSHARRQGGVPRPNPQIRHHNGALKSKFRTSANPSNFDRNETTGTDNKVLWRDLMTQRWQEAINCAVPYPGTGSPGETILYREEFDYD